MSRTDLLRDRSILALLAAEVISTTGAQMTWLALPWFVLVTSGSATHTTFVVAAEVIGLALLGLPGGRVLGRLGARRTMMLCDASRAPLMLVIPVLHWTVGVSFALLLAVAFALGAFAAPHFAAEKVIVPELIGEDEQRVGEANALFQGANRATILVGPALAGILIGLIGAAPVLVIDAATYVVALGLVAIFVPSRPPVQQDEEHRSVRAGLRFIKGDRLLRVWWPTFALGDAAWTAFFISVPVLVLDRFGHHASIAGLLIASFGIGALIGNAISFKYLTRRFAGLAVIATFAMFQALPLWFLWLPLPVIGLAALILASGIANGLVNPSLHTITTLRVPAPLRPNVLTTAMVGWAVVNPLGLFVTGPVLDAFGTTPVLVGFAVVQTAMMAVVAASSARELGRQRLQPAPAG
ncbi:MAG TPA: MFS transporter [Gaiellaceae bacterium]|nr:MFS transporter [Gaiellaceae bacterium]